MEIQLADLDLAPVVVQAEIVRLIEEHDLDFLTAKGRMPHGTSLSTGPGHVQRLTMRHHALARCLAEGMKPWEAGAVTGYSQARVSQMLTDPAFKELIISYKEAHDKVYHDLHARLANIAVDALDELHDRFEENPKAFSNAQTMQLLTLAADRTGHGPQSATLNTNVNVNMADRLEAARRRVADRMIDAKPIPQEG